MARETKIDTLLMGAVGAGVTAVIGSQALEYYRFRKRQDEPRIICRECGESVPVDDVLDPTETCACITSDAQTG